MDNQGGLKGMYERHEGDDLLSKDKRLQYKWKWSRVAFEIPQREIDKWTHFQVSCCRIGGWICEAIQWGHEPVYYEASISYVGSSIVSRGSNRETGYKTRIEAQIAAEKLLIEWVTKQYKELIK